MKRDNCKLEPTSLAIGSPLEHTSLAIGSPLEPTSLAIGSLLGPTSLGIGSPLEPTSLGNLFVFMSYNEVKWLTTEFYKHCVLMIYLRFLKMKTRHGYF